MKSKSIGILTKPKFPEVKSDSACDVVTWLRGSKDRCDLGHDVGALLVNERGRCRRPSWREKRTCFLSLAVTGQCSMLRELAGERGIPILGVNMGGLGFLTEVRLENLYPSLERVFANDYVLDERLMLQTHIHRHGETVAQGVVLNDVVISKGTLARMIELKIAIQGQFVTNLRGDGVDRQHPNRIDRLLPLGRRSHHQSRGAVADFDARSVPTRLTHRPLIVPGTPKSK